MSKKKTKSKSKPLKETKKIVVKNEPKLAKKPFKKDYTEKTPRIAVSTQLSGEVTRPLDNIKKKLIEQRALLAARAAEHDKEDTTNPFELESHDFDTTSSENFDEPELANDLFAPGTSQNGFSDTNGLNMSENGHSSLGFGTFETGVDIFKKYDDICVKAGDLCKFRIYKNNEFINTRTGPYSWEQLQKDFGPGQYRVQAYSASNGRILRTETQMIGADPTLSQQAQAQQVVNVEVEKMRLENERLKAERDAEIAKREREKEEARWERKEKRDEEMSIAKLALSFSKINSEPGKDNQIMQMIVEMQKSTFELMNQQKNDTAKMIESLAKLVMDSKPKSEVTPLDLIKAQQEAYERGKAEERRIQELVEKKAEVLAEKLADNDEPVEKDSLSETLIKAFAPVMAGALAQPKTPAQPLPQITQRPQIQHPRSQAPRVNPNIVVPPGTTSQAKAETKTDLSMPRASLDDLNEKLDLDSEEDSLETSDKSPNLKLNGSSSLVLNENRSTELKKNIDDTGHLTQDETSAQELTIRDLAIPLIAEKLVALAEPRASAGDILVELQKHGIRAKDVVQHWSYEKLVSYAHSLGVPEEANPWFKEFFSEIKQIAAPGDGRNS